jgi:hypothetical protein
LTPRIAIIEKIARKHRFLHWQLEFADIFQERGGFNLVLGNSPWIKLEFNEKAVLTHRNPAFTMKNLNAAHRLAGTALIPLKTAPPGNYIWRNTVT